MGNKYYSKKVLRKPLISLFYLILSMFFVILIFGIRDMKFNIWSKYFSIIILTQFVFQYIFLKLMNFKMYSLTGMFLILSYLFHFGQLFIMVFFPNYEFQRFNYYAFYDSYGLKIASEFALIIILMIVFGILLSTKKNKKNVKVEVENSFIHCRKVGWIIVFFTFPIQLYLDVIKLRISVTEGYLATYNTGIAGIWGSIGFISFTGFALLILGYSKREKKSLLIFVLVIIYLSLTMFTGHRGHQITIILFLLYIVHKSVYRINWKKVVIVSGIAFVAIAILNALVIYRGIQGKNLLAFWELFLNNLKGDPIKDFIIDLGGTINTMYLVIQQVPHDMPHAYGATYLASFFSIIPNIGKFFSDINTYAIYTKSLHGSALGGSYIGELYYNFSYFGIFFAVFIGALVNKISNKVEDLINKEDYFNLAYYVPIFIYILWWPRDTFYSIVRPFVWGAIVLFILNGIIKKRVKEPCMMKYSQINNTCSLRRG